MTLAQVNRALQWFPRMAEQSQAIARAFFVEGRLQVDLAREADLSRERVRYVCAQVYEKHLELAAKTARSSKSKPAAKPIAGQT